jgi:hypothetical protein
MAHGMIPGRIERGRMLLVAITKPQAEARQGTHQDIVDLARRLDDNLDLSSLQMALLGTQSGIQFLGFAQAPKADAADQPVSLHKHALLCDCMTAPGAQNLLRSELQGAMRSMDSLPAVITEDVELVHGVKVRATAVCIRGTYMVTSVINSNVRVELNTACRRHGQDPQSIIDEVRAALLRYGHVDDGVSIGGERFQVQIRQISDGPYFISNLEPWSMR